MKKKLKDTIKSFVDRSLSYISTSSGISPKEPFSTDVFLVSYPKSGNTWLRYVLSNYMVRYFDLPINVNWFTVQDLIPDWQAYGNIPKKNLISNSYGARILKTHCNALPAYKRAILLVRRPEDAIASCYNYYRLNTLIPESMSFGSFIENHPLGISGWNEHTLGWLKDYRIASVVKCFRFEDMKSDTFTVLSDIVDLLGIDVNEDYLLDSVRASSKEEMGRSEQKHRSDAALRTQGERFVGEGRVGRASQVASDSEIKYIIEKTKYAREIIGYE